MEIIDVMGKPCPIPVIEAKKALAKTGADSVCVLVDNIVAVQNLEKMAKGSGYGFSYTEKSDAAYEVVITHGGGTPGTISAPDKPIKPDSGSRRGLVVVIGKNRLGEGSQELGGILIKGFIYSLTELADPPAHVIFLNSGVFLTTEGSNTLTDLSRLEDKGTKIFSCGTCLNYYELSDKLSVGSIVNMFDITQTLCGATKIINV